MAHGESHAKETVLNQIGNLETQLTNGDAGNLETHGAALLLLIQMIKPIFNAQLVTEDECIDRMAKCPAANLKNTVFSWARTWAWLGSVSTVCATIIGVVYMVMK